MRAIVRLLLAAVAVLPLVACGDDADLPPGDEEGLVEVFQPFFDPLDLEFTYGSVSDGEHAKHVALYVEPTGPATDEQYLTRLVASTSAVAGFAFAEYEDLYSFDICQEPVPTGPDDPDKPEPRTVVVLTRPGFESVEDWDDATLADVIRASRVGNGGSVEVDESIAQLPAYVDALAEAGPDEEAAADVYG